MLFNILALISTIIFITLLRRLVNVFPSVIACLLRWKESVNIEASVKLAYDRDILALGMVVPFCLVAEKFMLYSPSFMDGMEENSRIGITFGVFFAYLLIRFAASLAVQRKKSKKKIYDTAYKASFTYFIILTLILVILGGILSFINIETEAVRSAMLYVSAFMYALFMLRKTQIFASGFSIFTCFLYLCALEIIPTGLLIASALII